MSFIIVLIIIACILLMLVVLIQNPKGGGLSQTFGGISNQILGVKRSSDYVEKATWGLAIVIIVLSLGSGFFVGGAPVEQSGPKSALENMEGGSAPANIPGLTLPVDTAQNP
jgi:preprotein translocase subunit SecG